MALPAGYNWVIYANMTEQERIKDFVENSTNCILKDLDYFCCISPEKNFIQHHKKLLSNFK